MRRGQLLVGVAYGASVASCSLLVDLSGLSDALPAKIGDRPDAMNLDTGNDGNPPNDPRDANAGDAAPDAEAIPCARKPLSSWSPPGRLTDLVGDDGAKGFDAPFVLPDGLTLWATKSASSCRHAVYRGTRGAEGQFQTMTRQALPGVDCAPPRPSAFKPDDVFYAGIGSGGAATRHSARNGSSWTDEAMVEFDTSDYELDPRITMDGVFMIFSRAGASPTNRFLEFHTASRIAPTSGLWSYGQKALPPPGYAPDSLAMTPDGLGLFWSTTDGKVWLLVRGSRSENIASRWAAAVEVADLSGRQVSVRSMTADGCELYLRSERDGAPDTYVAKRR